MNKRSVVLIAVAVSCTALLAWAAGAKLLNVQNRQSAVRSSPSALASVVATLNYGDQVTVVEEKGAWTKVTARNVTGWMSSQALTKKTIKISTAGTADTGASGDEMALAGKGFSADVEKQFKASHADVDFTWVDKMEKMKVTPEQMKEFLKDGKVTSAEGGAK